MTSLRQRMIEDMQVRNLSPNTQSSYVQQVSLFARYFHCSPERLGPEEIRSYQVYLTNEKKLSPGLILIAVCALRFLYNVTLHKEWSFQDAIPYRRSPRSCPSCSVQRRSNISSRASPARSTAQSSPPATRPGCECPKQSVCNPPPSIVSAWSSALYKARDRKTAMSCSPRGCWRSCATGGAWRTRSGLFPGDHRPAHYHRRRGVSVPRGPSAVRDPQARYAPFHAARLRGTCCRPEPTSVASSCF